MVVTDSEKEILINTCICVPSGLVMLIMCFWISQKNKKLL